MNRVPSLLSATALSLLLGATSVYAEGAADNTNSKVDPAFSTWMHSYSEAHNGYVSRDAYMEEAGRRWDAMDREHRGLTTEQIDSMYGYPPSPGQVNANGPRTNPTGTELKGQNSGGK